MSVTDFFKGVGNRANAIGGAVWGAGAAIGDRVGRTVTFLGKKGMIMLLIAAWIDGILGAMLKGFISLFYILINLVFSTNLSLKPGGFLLLDVYTLNGFDQREESASYELNQLFGFWSPDDYYGFVNTFKYDNEKVVLDKYTIIEESRKRVVYNWLQYYSKESLQKELEENGFKIEEFYEDVAGKPFDPESSEMAVVVKRL